MGKDGISNELFIVQARPETIHSKSSESKMMLYKIDEKLTSKLKKDGRVIWRGRQSGLGSGLAWSDSTGRTLRLFREEGAPGPH